MRITPPGDDVVPGRRRSTSRLRTTGSATSSPPAAWRAAWCTRGRSSRLRAPTAFAASAAHRLARWRQRSRPPPSTAGAGQRPRLRAAAPPARRARRDAGRRTYADALAVSDQPARPATDRTVALARPRAGFSTDDKDDPTRATRAWSERGGRHARACCADRVRRLCDAFVGDRAGRGRDRLPRVVADRPGRWRLAVASRHPAAGHVPRRRARRLRVRALARRQGRRDRQQPRPLQGRHHGRRAGRQAARHLGMAARRHPGERRHEGERPAADVSRPVVRARCTRVPKACRAASTTRRTGDRSTCR